MCIKVFMKILPSMARISTLGYMEFNRFFLRIIRERENWGLGIEMEQKADSKAGMRAFYSEVLEIKDVQRI